MTSDLEPTENSEPQAETGSAPAVAQEGQPVRRRVKQTKGATSAKPAENKVVRLLEKNPLGMTLPEMAGGPRQLKKIKALRPMLTEAIKNGLVMPVSQRAGNTVYRLVARMGPR